MSLYSTRLCISRRAIVSWHETNARTEMPRHSVASLNHSAFDETLDVTHSSHKISTHLWKSTYSLPLHIPVMTHKSRKVEVGRLMTLEEAFSHLYSSQAWKPFMPTLVCSGCPLWAHSSLIFAALAWVPPWRYHCSLWKSWRWKESFRVTRRLREENTLISHSVPFYQAASFLMPMMPNIESNSHSHSFCFLRYLSGHSTLT